MHGYNSQTVRTANCISHFLGLKIMDSGNGFKKAAINGRNICIHLNFSFWAVGGGG